ncbi:MAG: hypothetical protein IIC31_11305, partial [Chloroflexi bacterium]|nr:hypothetical protein [Chloroflexota bacterium]
MSLLPGERFDLALDARRGVVTASEAGENVLTVTTHRVILRSAEPGKRTTALLPLSKLTGVEVLDVYRATERLPQGLLLLAAGVLLGWLSWTIVGVVLISLLLGGLPVLAAIYILTGYVLPDQEGALVVHAGGYALRHVLRSADARRDAYLVAQRLYELAAVARSEPTAEPAAPKRRRRKPSSRPSGGPPRRPRASTRCPRSVSMSRPRGPGRPPASPRLRPLPPLRAGRRPPSGTPRRHRAPNGPSGPRRCARSRRSPHAGWHP